MDEIKIEGFQIVVFGLGNENFGIDIKDLLEIVKPEKITRVPNTEFFVEGVINLRGKIIVVVDLLKKLSGEAIIHSNNSRILIIKTEQELIGLLVERCDNVVSVSKDEILRTPNFLSSRISSDFIKGIVNTNNYVREDVQEIIKEDMQEDVFWDETKTSMEREEHRQEEPKTEALEESDVEELKSEETKAENTEGLNIEELKENELKNEKIIKVEDEVEKNVENVVDDIKEKNDDIIKEKINSSVKKSNNIKSDKIKNAKNNIILLDLKKLFEGKDFSTHSK